MEFRTLSCIIPLWVPKLTRYDTRKGFPRYRWQGNEIQCGGACRNEVPEDRRRAIDPGIEIEFGLKLKYSKFDSYGDNYSNKIGGSQLRQGP